MKVRKSSIERKSGIRQLPIGKALIRCSTCKPEYAWVAKDEENKVMYLLNSLVSFHPMPSWGMELPLGEDVDVTDYRGASTAFTDITVCSEMYKHLKPYIGDDDEFDHARFMKDEWKDADKHIRNDETSPLMR